MFDRRDVNAWLKKVKGLTATRARLLDRIDHLEELNKGWVGLWEENVWRRRTYRNERDRYRDTLLAIDTELMNPDDNAEDTLKRIQRILDRRSDFRREPELEQIGEGRR